MKGYAHRPSPLSESRSSRQACVTLHPAPCRAMLLYMNDTVLSRTGDAFLCACAPAGALLRRNAESRNAAAGGRGRHCGKPAAVGESEEQRKPERFSGYRKAAPGTAKRPRRGSGRPAPSAAAFMLCCCHADRGRFFVSFNNCMRRLFCLSCGPACDAAELIICQQ